ncbi:hypothetical protein GCM10009743_40040 [Kribbella swartbergensis]
MPPMAASRASGDQAADDCEAYDEGSAGQTSSIDGGDVVVGERLVAGRGGKAGLGGEVGVRRCRPRSGERCEGESDAGAEDVSRDAAGDCYAAGGQAADDDCEAYDEGSAGQMLSIDGGDLVVGERFVAGGDGLGGDAGARWCGPGSGERWGGEFDAGAGRLLLARRVTRRLTTTARGTTRAVPS